MKPTAPDGTPLPHKHVAHFLDTLRWAGVTLEDCGGAASGARRPRRAAATGGDAARGGDSGVVEGDGGGRP